VSLWDEGENLLVKGEDEVCGFKVRRELVPQVEE
jgi:hypothetical protein